MNNGESTFEFNGEMNFEEEEFGFGESEWAGEDSEVFDEQELTDLASELLEISSEEELNYFLGKLVKRAAGAIGKVVKSPVGKAIGGVLKMAAKKALPIAGAALGGFVGGPLGAKIGSGLANAAGSALGLEAESLSHEDQQYEGAKQFVRFAGATVKNAVASPSSQDPRAAAQKAAVMAARALAPGLIAAAQGGQGGPGRRGSSGRWVRQGRNIVILNV